MGKIIVDVTTSLDGYIAGPDDGPEQPLGEGGEKLHEWVYGLKSWREPHGLEGGETNEDSAIMEETFSSAGAIIVGKRMFDNAGGWGDEPPFKMPVFVLTHEAREPEAKSGGTTFTFIDGVERALREARAAAGDKNVNIGGGANTIQQFLGAGLVDEIQVHFAPMLLGGGVRLFDDRALAGVRLEPTRVADSPAVTHLRYRIVK